MYFLPADKLCALWLTVMLMWGPVPALPGQREIPDLQLVWIRVGDSFGQVDKENGIASVECAEFSPDGTKIASGAKRGGDVFCWSIDGDELWHKKHKADPEPEVEVITWTKDSRYVLSGGENCRIHVWRASDGVLVKTLPHIASIDGMRMSHKGDILAAGTEAGEIVIWDISNPDPSRWPGKPLYTLIQGPDQDRGGSGHSDVNSIDWTDDDAYIVTAGRNSLVKRWETARFGDADQGLVKSYTGFQSSIKSNRISPDETLIAAGGQLSPHASMIVWDFQTGERTQKIDIDTFSKFEAVEFTPDGRYLIAGGNEGAGGGSRDNFPGYPANGGFGFIRWYDVENNLELVHEEPCFRQEYFQFSPDGRLLLSSHEDGTLRLWRVTARTLAADPFSNIQFAGQKSFETARIRSGEPLYLDGINEFRAVPAFLVDQWFIRPRLVDRTESGGDYLSFDLDGPTTLFVGYNGNAPTIPDWLQDWQKVDTVITFNPVGPNAVNFLDVYQKFYPAGTVSLPGNAAPPARAMGVNYIVAASMGKVLVGVPKIASGPDDFMMMTNYPNPFNAQTTIEYRIPQDAAVLLDLYDINGRHVETLENRFKKAGGHRIAVHAGNLASGTYFARLTVTSENFYDHRMIKLLLIK